MHPHLNTRDTVRAGLQAPIIIENEDSGRIFRGLIYKHSRFGLCFESDYPVQPGTIVKLRSTFLKSSSGGFFPTEVKSCEKINNPLALLQYRIGACFCDDSDYKNFVRRELRVIQGGKKEC